MSLAIVYRVDQAGWADAEIYDEHSRVRLTASYVSDTLTQLAESALAVLDGADTARVVFEEEPGEQHVVFRSFPNRASSIVEIRRFADEPPDPKASRAYSVVGKLAASRREFATAVESALSAVLAECGIHGYERRWGLPFPVALHTKLRKRLLETRAP